jgi:hypothetical protein
MNIESPTRRASWSLLGAIGMLSLVLALLFHQLLLPGRVMFSNDAPLGLLAAQANIVWSNFLAYWADLNWVGVNAPSGAPSVTPVAYALLGPVLYAKFDVPLCLMLLGLAAWFFARQNKFHGGVAILTGLAAALNSNPVSYACWGLPPKAVTMGSTLLAIGLLQSKGEGWRRWAKVILAGFSVGIGVVEGADVGAILSLYVAGFAAWQWFAEEGNPKSKALRSGATLGLVTICAGWIATHSLASLVGTQIKGVAGMEQNQESIEQRWDFATFGSFPPQETLRILVPGLFGYRMDTPAGGAYWGGVGSDGKPEHRFSGSGEYAGVLVVFIALFAIANSFRKEKSPFSTSERRYVWFWGAAALASLLLAFGRFAPFYRLLFDLPYFSTIRFPGKFLHGMDICLTVLFAYGLEAMARLYLTPGVSRVGSLGETFGEWRRRGPEWDRRWIAASWIAVGAAVAGAIMYMSSFQSLEQYIARIPFQDDKASAWFSIREGWEAVGFLALSVLALTLAAIGWFSGARSRAVWWVLGSILVIDMVRANFPWVKTYDYRARYQSNVVLDLLKDRPWEHRVSAYLSPQRMGLLIATTEFAYLQKEWLENQFQFFNIQSIDIDQMARTPELEKIYIQAFQPPNFGLAAQFAAGIPQLNRLPPDQTAQVKEMMPAVQSNLFPVTRLWELTNTRYVLGWADGIETFNKLFDPLHNRFQVRAPFGLALKSSYPAPSTNTPIADTVQAYTAIPSERGPLALIEFTGALPRAKLYTQWESIADDRAALSRLLSPGFDPAKSVVIDGTAPGINPTPDLAGGEVSFESYSPKHVVLKTKAASAGVLLLNDRWHENWKTTVDGQPVPLLRANFLMRAVPVPAGEHSVEFVFDTPAKTLWISLAGVICGLALACILIIPRSNDV